MKQDYPLKDWAIIGALQNAITQCEDNTDGRTALKFFVDELERFKKAAPFSPIPRGMK